MGYEPKGEKVSSSCKKLTAAAKGLVFRCDVAGAGSRLVFLVHHVHAQLPIRTVKRIKRRVGYRVLRPKFILDLPELRRQVGEFCREIGAAARFFDHLLDGLVSTLA